MVRTRYSQKQILWAVKGRVAFADFINQVIGNSVDYRLLIYIDRLLLNIYLLHLDGKYMSKTQACRLIPAEHIDTCKKYVAEAERLGFFRLIEDNTDKRRKNVVPTEEFIAFVRGKAVTALQEAQEVLYPPFRGT